MEKYDLIVIGAGPAGYEAAAIAVRHGMRTLLVEKDHLGGTCLNKGCIPTKAFCRSAQVAADVAGASAFGVMLPAGASFSVDMARVVERKDAVVAQLREAVAAECYGAEILHAEARFAGAQEIEAAGRMFTAPKIIVATGSRSASLPVEGAELCVTSTELLEMTVLPRSLAIIGGGVIGMEFASVFAAFGVPVTVIEYCKEVLPAFDKDVAKQLRTVLKRRGVEFHTEAEVCAVHGADGALKCVEYRKKGKTDAVEAEYVLMAVGRHPVVPDGLTEAGAVVGRRGIEVDSRFETAIKGVYAVGDCNGISLLAHAAAAQANLVMDEEVDLSVIPAAVFTVPECAMVGLTEEQCRNAGIQCKVSKCTFRSNGKALAMGEPEGVVKVVADLSTGIMLGCQIVGPHAADIIAEAALAVSSRLPVSAVARTIHSHPTLGEALQIACR